MDNLANYFNDCLQTMERLKSILTMEGVTYHERLFESEDSITGLGENPFVSMHVWLFIAHTHTHKHTHTYMYACMYAHMHTPTHTCTHMHMHAHTCMHTRTHMHTHTHTMIFSITHTQDGGARIFIIAMHSIHARQLMCEV